MIFLHFKRTTRTVILRIVCREASVESNRLDMAVIQGRDDGILN